MKQLFSAAWCWLFGHRRGKRVFSVANAAVELATGKTVYSCPRCSATWARKVKKTRADQA